ncbi:MAG: hypothetical protein MUC80_00370 [Candidatus Thermoplasmatota archaeon]|nr:hypothetical protein [Candidatus Thermoplasmatota archaeon]
MNLPGKVLSAWDLVFVTLPSLMLSFAVVVMVVCVHHISSQEKKVWSHIGIVFATLYTSLVSIAYIVALLIVVPNMMVGDYASVAYLDPLNRESFLQPVDALGYGFLSLSFLFAAQIFSGKKLEKWVRISFLAHGLLAPFIVASYLNPDLIYIGALWIITFPLSTMLLAMLFRKKLSETT